jgi:hypothetical protein
MRIIAFSVLLGFLCVLTWVSYGSVESSASAPPRMEWRRTRIGWERKELWSRTVSVPEKPLHPLIVGGFQLAASVAALIAFSKDPDIR